MKKILLLCIFLAASAAIARAQSIALGERVPEVKASVWLGGSQPKDAEITYVEFFQSSNKACLKSIEQLSALSNKLGTKLRVIVVTKDAEEKITPLLSPHLTPWVFVALDPAGRVFEAYGVSYLPFGVLTDAKNRALWLGNSLQLTEEVIQKSK